MSNGNETTDPSVTLYATQGGGYAVFQNGQYVWHSEVPDFLPDAKIGDPIPDKWDVVSISDEARFLEEEEFSSEEQDLQAEEDENTPSAQEVRHRIQQWAGGNTELEREAAELYSGDFVV